MPRRRRWEWGYPRSYYTKTRSYFGDRRKTVLIVIVLLIVLLALWNQPAQRGSMPKMKTVSIDIK